MSISNISGTFTGNQRLGNVTIRINRGSEAKDRTQDDINNPSHDGDFDGAKTIDISSISGLYDGRFDDYDYYPWP